MPQPVPTFRALFVALSLIPLTALAKSPPSEPVDETLVIGDTYTVRADRHGVQKEFSGPLLKANDQWIVLHYVVRGRRELGVPFLSKLPVVGDGFRIKGVTPRDEFLWI